MKKNHPIIIAFNLSLLITLFVVCINAIIGISVYGNIEWLGLIVIAVCVFVFSFILLRWSLKKFIYNRIKVIYRTIHDLMVTKDAPSKKAIEGDWYGEIEKDVEQWANAQNKEIEDLRRLEKYRRDFLGSVSHELKTPIFNIQGYVLTLLEGGLEDASINREYLLRTELNIDRMVAIINDLETISKLESGVLKLQYQKFDLVALTREIVDFYEMNARERSISLIINRATPVMVSADKERIRHVLANLVENSIKYGMQNGRTLISFYDMDQNVLTEIEDNGMGIYEEDIPRVFERFFRTSQGRSREKKGTGLGLAIVKHIIEAHKQAINVKSSPGRGTTFTFTLKKG